MGCSRQKPTYPYRRCCMEFQTFFNVSQPEKLSFFSPPPQHPLLELWQRLFLFTETRQLSNYKGVGGGGGSLTYLTKYHALNPLFWSPVTKDPHFLFCFFLLFCFYLSCQKVSFPSETQFCIFFFFVNFSLTDLKLARIWENIRNFG